MKWVEMVRLRSLENREKALLTLLDDTLKDIHQTGLTRVRLHKNASFRGDISVTFDWDADVSEARESKSALSIAQMLKEYGLVEYSMWLEYDLCGSGGAL
jgi:hypothetical protein